MEGRIEIKMFWYVINAITEHPDLKKKKKLNNDAGNNNDNNFNFINKIQE
jgi:hypothetical protein